MLTIRWRSAMWFASGLAVALLAVAVFAGVRARAAAGDEETTFVPTTPCRLFDTRAGADNVGPRDTPIGADESHTQQVTGTNGNCTVPANATGIALNVTATNPTEGSFLTIYPADATLPNASNVNFLAGQSPTPNKVDVKLSATGAINVFNKFGNVNVLADVAGYYTPAGLNAMKASLASLQSQLDALTVTVDGLTPSNGQIVLAGADFAPEGYEYVRWDDDRGGIANAIGSHRYCVIAKLDLPVGSTVNWIDYFAHDILVNANVQFSSPWTRMELYEDSYSTVNNKLVYVSAKSNNTGDQHLANYNLNVKIKGNKGYVLKACGFSSSGIRMYNVTIAYSLPAGN